MAAMSCSSNQIQKDEVTTEQKEQNKEESVEKQMYQPDQFSSGMVWKSSLLIVESGRFENKWNDTVILVCLRSFILELSCIPISQEDNDKNVNHQDCL